MGLSQESSRGDGGRSTISRRFTASLNKPGGRSRGWVGCASQIKVWETNLFNANAVGWLFDMSMVSSVMQTARNSARLSLSWPSRQSANARRSEEHTSELQSLMRISYAVFCCKKRTMQYTKCDNISRVVKSILMRH